MNLPSQLEHEARLIAMVRSSKELMAALTVVRSLGLNSWCIGAGAVRSLVWDALHGYDQRSACEDIDVVYFDNAMGNPEHDADLERRLRSALPGPIWEVTNQATVHAWFAKELDQTVPPFQSLEEGVATWPEFATCVGVKLDDNDSIKVIAPHGLDDLFGLRVRHNPLRADAVTFRQRVRSKRFGQRWPLLRVEEY